MPKRRKVRSNAEEDLRPLDSIVNFQVNSLFKCGETSLKQLTKRFNSVSKDDNSAGIMMAISDPTLENLEDELNASGLLNKYKSVIDHILDRPSYSFFEMVDWALTENNSMTVTEIYDWIRTKFPYFKYEKSNKWKNAVRHALIHEIFCKVKKSGSHWAWSKKSLAKLDSSNSRCVSACHNVGMNTTMQTFTIGSFGALSHNHEELLQEGVSSYQYIPNNLIAASIASYHPPSNICSLSRPVINCGLANQVPMPPTRNDSCPRPKIEFDSFLTNIGTSAALQYVNTSNMNTGVPMLSSSEVSTDLVNLLSTSLLTNNNGILHNDECSSVAQDFSSGDKVTVRYLPDFQGPYSSEIRETAAASKINASGTCNESPEVVYVFEHKKQKSQKSKHRATVLLVDKCTKKQGGNDDCDTEWRGLECIEAAELFVQMSRDLPSASDTSDSDSLLL